MRLDQASDKTMPLRPTHDILLTGATGFLGHYLLREYLSRNDIRCRILVRPPLWRNVSRMTELLAELNVDAGKEIRSGRLLPFEGELPGSIDPAAAQGTTDIVHAVANTRFHGNRNGEPFRTNVEGTRAILKLASDAHVRHVVLISTAHVCGRRAGRIPEAVSESPPDFFNEYEESKWEAERLAWRWRGPGRRVTVFRPSILIGDRSTGRATSMGGIYLIARATEILARSVFAEPTLDPFQIDFRIPGSPDAEVNLMPVCVAAGEIARFSMSNHPSSAVRHVVNDRPPTYLEIKEWLEEFFEIGGGNFVGASPDKPNVQESLFLSACATVLDYFRRDVHFEASEEYRAAGAPPLVDRHVFLRCLRYARSANWNHGRRPKVNRRARASMDPAIYFERFLPEVIGKSIVARLHMLTTVIRFRVGDSTVNEWTCRFDRGALVGVVRGADRREEEFGYRISPEGFAEVISGRATLQEVFFRGAADLMGNQERALKMVPVMEAFLREFPVAPD
jgi:nucleoside-diphosphate-sugar epimerase